MGPDKLLNLRAALGRGNTGEVLLLRPSVLRPQKCTTESLGSFCQENKAVIFEELYFLAGAKYHLKKASVDRMKIKMR